jgi:tetratricopeptide (TPR) repeat protein
LQRNYQQAIMHFQSALEHNPNNANAYQGLGLTQRRLGNTDAAIGTFLMYLRLNPEAADRADLEAWMQKHSQIQSAATP